MNKIKLSLLTAAFWASFQVPVQAEPNCPQDAVDLCHQLIGFLNKEEAAGKLKPAGILWDGEHLHFDTTNPLSHEWVGHLMFNGIEMMSQDLSITGSTYDFEYLVAKLQRMKTQLSLMGGAVSFSTTFRGESFEETVLAQAYKDYQAPVSPSVVPAQPKGPRAEDAKKDGPAGGSKAPLKLTNPAQIPETGDIAIQKTAAQLADKSRGRANLVVPVIKIPVKPDPAMKLPLNTPVAPDPAMKLPLNTPVTPGSSPMTPYPEPGQPPAITASKPTDPPPVKDTVVTPVAGSNSGTSITPPRTPSVGPQMAATATPGPRTSKPDASGKVGPRAGDLIQKAPPGVPRNDLGGAPGMTPPVPNPSNAAPPIVTPYKAPPPVTITGTAVPTDNGGYTITFDPDQFITPYPEPGQPPAITASKPTDPPPVKDTVVTPVAGSNSGTSITPPRTPSVGPQMAATATPGPRTSKPDASGKVGPRAGDLIQKAPPGVPRNDLGGAPGMTPPVPNPSNAAPPIVTPYKAPPPVTITGTAVPTPNGGYAITFDPNQLAGLTTKGNKQDKTVGGAKPGPLALSPMQTLQQASKFGKGAGANSKQRTPQSAIQIAGLVSSSAVSAPSVSGNVGSGANQGSAQAKVEARPHAISLQHASSNCGGQRVGTAEINDCFVTARAGNQLDHNERAYSFDSEGKVWSCKLSGLGSRVMKDQDGQLTHEGHLETIHFASRSLSHIPSGQLSTNRCLIAVHK